MHASAGWYGDHTVDATSAGVTVRKGLDLDTLALPALKFEIRSERDDPVGVRVVDQLPATVDPSRVGLHADFAADQWTAFEDGRVAFTTRLDPERPVVTLYGIWIDDPERVHELLGRPDVKVTSDPDAPSLEPRGDEVKLPTVDDSLRSVGPDALVELREDVEEALTAVRAEPREVPTALPAPGAGFDGDGDGDGDGDARAGTMGDHAWTYPVERMGTGRVAAPTHADLDELVEGDVDEGHVYLRAALADTHHGGGGAVLLQELANAFQVVARRVTGDAERATVDAVVQTPLGTDAVLSALADREQVTDALVSPLVGDRDDATGIDAAPEEDVEAAARDGTEEFSIEPDSEDVEVVLNADGERFAELKSEFEQETDTDALEDELSALELPGVDTSDEPTIDELVDDDTVEFGDDSGGFVPASVDGGDALSFDDDATELDFAADGDAVDDTATGSATESSEDGGSATGADDAPFEFVADATGSDVAEADATDADASDSHTAVDDDATSAFDAEVSSAFDDVADDAFEAAVERGFLDENDDVLDENDDALAANDETASTNAMEAADVETVEVPVRELEAVRAEVRELRDRVATLEGDLATVRADLSRERHGHSPTPEPMETSEDAE